MKLCGFYATSATIGIAFAAAAIVVFTPKPVEQPPLFFSEYPDLKDCNNASIGAAVFTGSGARMRQAYTLIQTHAVHNLLISGVGSNLDAKTLAIKYGVTLTDEDAGRITHDRSPNTKANAVNTADWLRKNGMTCLVLVTSDAHMDRAIFLMREAAPDLSLKILPVHDDWPELKAAWETALEKLKLTLAQRGIESFGSIDTAQREPPKKAFRHAYVALPPTAG